MLSRSTEAGGFGDLILCVDHLAIEFETAGDPVLAVRDVTFDIRSGETVALVGESGCGKSTTAYGLIGYLGANGRVCNGSIEFLGRDLVHMGARELRKLRGNKVSMVFQDPSGSLNPSLRVGTQLTEILTEHDRRIGHSAAVARCVEILELVHMPDAEGCLGRYPHQLSGGQQQRVVIAGALLNEPSLLIMDEPTTALDVTVQATVLDLVATIKQEFGAAVLFITHDLGVVAQVADTVCVMYAGEIVEQAGVVQLFEEPRHPYTKGLLASIPQIGVSRSQTTLRSVPGGLPSGDTQSVRCLFEPRCYLAKPKCAAEHPVLDDGRAGDHAARCFYSADVTSTVLPATPPMEIDVVGVGERSPDTVLSVRGLRTYYRRPNGFLRDTIAGRKTFLKAVDGVDLEVRSGETLGIVGESGSGKSTIARTILGLESLTEGEMEFMGIDISCPAEKRSKDTLRRLQMVFQNPDATLNPSITVGSAIARSLRQLTDLPRNEERRRTISLLESVKLGERYYERLPRQLSGGEKQRVAIARTLASSPELIVADEPTSALDVSVQADVLNLLTDIQRRSAAALLLISHDISVVMYLADYIAVVYLGHVVEHGPTDTFLHPPYHPYTEALLSAVPYPDPTLHVKKIRLDGDIPSAIRPPPGCVFHTRCPQYIGEVCKTEPPRSTTGDGHVVACHHEIDTLSSRLPVINPARGVSTR